MGQTITSGDLVKKLGGELIGDPNILINSVASLESADQNSISFFNNPKYSNLLKITKAAVVIIDKDDLPDRSGTSIVIDNPYLYFAKVSQLLNPSKTRDFIIRDLSKIGKRYKIETRPFFQILHLQSSPAKPNRDPGRNDELHRGGQRRAGPGLHMVQGRGAADELVGLLGAWSVSVAVVLATSPKSLNTCTK